MSTVSDLLRTKERLVHTIGKTATVFEAVSKMVAKNVGALVVLDEGTPCGIITERDYLRKIAVEGRSSKTTFVAEIMSAGLVYVDPDTEVEECMSLMTHRRIRHLPVLDAGHLVGLISIGDAVKSLASERQSQVEELTAYVQGRYG
jgi:CBS domain-containing protein